MGTIPKHLTVFLLDFAFLSEFSKQDKIKSIDEAKHIT